MTVRGPLEQLRGAVGRLHSAGVCIRARILCSHFPAFYFLLSHASRTVAS
jgi:hypothetical protein